LSKIENAFGKLSKRFPLRTSLLNTRHWAPRGAERDPVIIVSNANHPFSNKDRFGKPYLKNSVKFLDFPKIQSEDGNAWTKTFALEFDHFNEFGNFTISYMIITDEGEISYTNC